MDARGMKTVIVDDREFQVVYPTKALMNSNMVADVIASGRYFGVDTKTQELTIIPKLPLSNTKAKYWYQIQIKDVLPELTAYVPLPEKKAMLLTAIRSLHTMWPDATIRSAALSDSGIQTRGKTFKSIMQLTWKLMEASEKQNGS